MHRYIGISLFHGTSTLSSLLGRGVPMKINGVACVMMMMIGGVILKEAAQRPGWEARGRLAEILRRTEVSHRFTKRFCRSIILVRFGRAVSIQMTTSAPMLCIPTQQPWMHVSSVAGRSRCVLLWFTSPFDCLLQRGVEIRYVFKQFSLRLLLLIITEQIQQNCSFVSRISNLGLANLLPPVSFQ